MAKTPRTKKIPKKFYIASAFSYDASAAARFFRCLGCRRFFHGVDMD